LNKIGIHHSLTKNIYKNFKEEENQYITENNYNKSQIIHNYEKQYYLNLEQINKESRIKNHVEILDEEKENLDTKKIKKANYLEVNSKVFKDLNK